MRCVAQQCGGWRRGVGLFAVDDGDVLVLCWAREETGTSEDSVRERGVGGIKFPMVEGKRRNEKAIGAGVRTMALTQEQLQHVTDVGDSWRRWSARWMRWSLANS